MICGKPVEEEIFYDKMMVELEKYLSIGALSLGINMKREFVGQLIHYLKMIKLYQKKVNITSITDPYEIISKHFLDSISSLILIRQIIGRCQDEKKTKLIDIGSGAGFPGIPIKILLPCLDMTLLESRKNKKIFLDMVREELRIKNMNIIQNRAEVLGRAKEYRESYHVTLSRAVAPLAVLCEYCLPLCKIGGAMMAYKGTSYQEELDQSYQVIERLGGVLENIYFVTMPFSNHIRSILMIRKTSATPESFPRRNGIPLKRPLSF